MTLLNAPDNVTFTDETSGFKHFKSLINFFYAQVQLHADKPLARYLHNNQYTSLTYAQVDQITTKLACKWAKDADGIQVVSYINDHNVDYFLVLIALLKLRTTLFTISPRNSQTYTMELLEKTQSKLVLVGDKHKDKVQDTASKVIVIKKLDIQALLNEPLDKNILDLNFSDKDIEKPALILHSSGTTGAPKPIYLCNRALLCFPTLFNMNIPSETITCNDVFLACVPLFHLFGFSCIVNMISFGGSVIFMDKLPPTQIELTKALNIATFLGAPPVILEQIASYIKATPALKYVIFGGAPLKDSAAEWYKSKGININGSYGSTEMGNTMASNFQDDTTLIRPFHRDENGELYGCFEVSDMNEPDLLHFYLRPGYPGLARIKSNRQDGGYSSNDLFRKDGDYYQYVGRRDDTLVMKNGEKTNPIPMETTLRQCPIIKQALVVAHDRDCTAALIELETEFAFDYGPDDMIALVQQAAEQVNQECPEYSALFPQMIQILPFNQSLPTTDKGTLRRKPAEEMYRDVIEELYVKFLEGSNSANSKETSTWTREQTQDFLMECTCQVLKMDKAELDHLDRSVFDYGLNSLSAIQLRNLISEYFENVSQTFLYQNSSINAMCEALFVKDGTDYIEKRVQQTQDIAVSYIERAKVDFPVARSQYDKGRDLVVLLTGVTGSLGSFMLQYLLQNKRVKKVYCCIRGEEDQLFQRLEDAFKQRSLDVSLLKTDRVQVLPMQFNAPFLGLTEEHYTQLKNQVTVIQHCAWLLDFNLPVDHYDKECIAPFYNLLKFAYREENPIHVHFISSISASAAYGADIPEEPLPLDANMTMPMGYAQSKFIVEVLFDYLVTEKNFPCYIERVGQVCGDSVNGVWNTSEQYPLMFMGGGAIMNKMPALDIVIDWIPVDYAARTVADIMVQTAGLSANREQSVYHIVNPKTIAWNDVLGAMKRAGMTFDVVPPSEWVECLSKDDTNPAYKLMGFYETNFIKTLDMPVWKTQKTIAMAPVMKDSPVIDGELFKKFLDCWQTIGFLTLE